MKKNEHRPTERVLDILELLSSNPEGLTLTEISNLIDAPKSSLYPVIHTMAARKFIFMNKNTYKYTIGISSYCIGSSYTNNVNILEFIKTEMKYIVDNSGEICQLGVLDGNQVLYIAKVDSEEPIRLISSVGKRLPAYCTSLGKSLIFNKNLDELKLMYPYGLKAYTENTITDIEVLYNQLLKVRYDGYSTENMEINDYTSCISVPLFKDSQILAAISVSIPSFRFNEEKFEIIKNLLLEVRLKIETFFKSNDIDPDIFAFNSID
ncbi:IclR family transcriptional regulator [Clostridium sp. C8]|uniref:IclR family transcriptional regulator n=1 Tax=Clostridium sp. C8 TaxID=1667357 RepID=UPI00062E7BD9|nr:IclR family transcriptional regulator [Clostridium sp. C8]KLE14436.1 IclR family transcriptional regulator [Clostridium sp. C8]